MAKPIPQDMSNEAFLKSEHWLTILYYKITILILFPIYTMFLCYALFFFLLIKYPITRAPLILYYTYIFFFDHQPSHGWSWWSHERIEQCRAWTCWRLARDYFPNSKLIKTCELPPEYNYLFLYHPHGIISMSLQIGLALNPLNFLATFPGIKRRVCTLVASFKFPFFRELLLANGYLDCKKSTISTVLSSPGESLVLVPGGANEALHSHPGMFKLHLLNRFGFVKIALKTGASLVPCLGFGENELFSTVDNQSSNIFARNLYKVQVFMMKRLSFSAPIMTQLFPKRGSLVCVVGAPIHLKKRQTDNPSEELIQEVHKEYIDALKALYEAHKVQYGNNIELQLT